MTESTDGSGERFKNKLRASRVGVIWNALKRNCQFILIAFAIVLGFVIGVLIHDDVQQSTEPATEELVMYIRFPGELFIRMLRMIILPLTISSVVVALAEIDTKSAGKLGKRTLLYYFTTTLIACTLGIALMKIINPGNERDFTKTNHILVSNQLSTLDSLLDLLRNMFPDNLVQATLKSQTLYSILPTIVKRRRTWFGSPVNFKEKNNWALFGVEVYLKAQTNYIGKPIRFRYKKQNISEYNSSAEEMSAFLKTSTILPWDAGNQQVTIILSDISYTYGGTVMKNGTNFLGLIVFSIVLGIIVQKLGEDGRLLLNLFSSLLKAIMMLVSAIMWFSPIGICSLIAGSLAEVEDIAGTFRALGLYVATILTGVFIQSFIVYPLIYLIVVRKNPFVYLLGLIPAIVTALGTSSSSATLPVTIRCVTKNNQVDRRVAQFVLPVGATCNMDGSAMIFSITALFIANLEGISLNTGEMVMTVLVSAFVSAGASGIPSAGLTYTFLVLEAVGLPTRQVGLIFATEWIGDRAVTANNVLGDAFGAGLMSHMFTRNPQVDNEHLPEECEKVKHDKMETESHVTTNTTSL